MDNAPMRTMKNRHAFRVPQVTTRVRKIIIHPITPHGIPGSMLELAPHSEAALLLETEPHYFSTHGQLMDRRDLVKALFTNTGLRVEASFSDCFTRELRAPNPQVLMQESVTQAS